MYSTLNNIVKKRPTIDSSCAVGKYLLYPNTLSNRKAEGGMRLCGRYKGRSDLNPLVSVVTTVCNRESVVEKAICSVLMQTYENIEYIVVDGASTDDTLTVIKKYDDVIDYYVSEPDSGLYEGMNKGLELAQGDFILILNSDDWYETDCVQRLVAVALADNLDLVCALATETDAASNVLRNIPMMPFRDNVRLRMPLRHETMLVSRSLYNRVGLYDETYKIIGDLKLTQKMYDQTNGFHQLNENVMFFRRMGVASELTKTLIAERGRLLQEQFPFLEKTEVEFFANEYAGDILPYVMIAKKYKNQIKFVKGVKGFLGLHGLLSPEHLSDDLVFFNRFN